MLSRLGSMEFIDLSAHTKGIDLSA